MRRIHDGYIHDPSLPLSLVHWLPYSQLPPCPYVDLLLRQADRQVGGNGRRRATCTHAERRETFNNAAWCWCTYVQHGRGETCHERACLCTCRFERRIKQQRRTRSGGPGGLAPLVAPGATAQLSGPKGHEKMQNHCTNLPSKDELQSCPICGDPDD